MDINERLHGIYESLVRNVLKRKEKGLFTALGYSSNLDVLLAFRTEQLNELLMKHHPQLDIGKAVPSGRIRSMQELLETIVYFCGKGIGGEVDIENPSLLLDNFSWSYGMGGTGVQAALALAQIGCESIVHLTDDSREVLDLLNSSCIHVALEDGSLGRPCDVKSRNPGELHFILQFKKGDLIRLAGQEICIPASNRLILTKNTVNEILPLWDPYFRWIEKNACRVSSIVLSSFNSIVDPAVLLERIEYVKEHAERYHRNNPDGIVYFEDAHYHDAEVRGMCMDIIYPHVDIMSMNEEELQYTLEEMFAFHVDIDDILSCVDGTDFLRKRYGVKKGIVVHTKDYAMFVGDPGKIDIGKGLAFGVSMATAKAAFGSYGGEQEIRSILRLPFSEQGLRNLAIIENSVWKDRVILVPTRYIDRPRYTIGLGDSFTGGMQVCF